MKRLFLLVLALSWLSAAHAAFTDHGDGTVTDTETGLMWDKCSYGQNNDATCSGPAGTYTWQAALQAAVTANTANHKGHDDWRLPNVKELESIVKIDAQNPAIDTAAFPNTHLAWYWSSTVYVSAPTYAWMVVFNVGIANAFVQTSSDIRVRLVRGGQSFDSFDLLGPSLAGTPANGAVGVAYSFTPTLTGSPTVTLIAGSLPPGLSLNPTTGAITGTPTTVGSYSFTLKASSATPSASNLFDLTIVIAAAGGASAIPTLSEWGMLLMSMLLAGAAFFRLRRRSKNGEEKRRSAGGSPCRITGFSYGNIIK